jgi:adenosylcobinamide-phosphate synthase
VVGARLDTSRYGPKQAAPGASIVLLSDPQTVLAGVLLALALDVLLGDPAWLYGRVPHPVAVIGGAVSYLERTLLEEKDAPARQRRLGALLCLAVTVAAAVLGVALQWLCVALPAGWFWLALPMSTLIAWRGLHRHVAEVADALRWGLPEARRAVADIVGRDPESLDEPAVARAAIESTAENFSDGVVAPLFWGVLFGLPGMLAYKTVNTLDSMIGHRSPRHLHFGRFSARLDDAVNWLPARLSALLILMAALLVPGANLRAGWRALRRDARRHRSPNAGWPEAAMAGCLGLQLAGPRRYGGTMVEDAWMGDGRAGATSTDIRRALRMMACANALAAALLALLLAIVGAPSVR